MPSRYRDFLDGDGDDDDDEDEVVVSPLRGFGRIYFRAKVGTRDKIDGVVGPTAPVAGTGWSFIKLNPSNISVVQILVPEARGGPVVGQS